MLSAFILANILTGAVGACYMGGSIGAKLGRAINRKRLGKYSRYNEVVTVRTASEIIGDDYFCHKHKQWNWAGNEFHCCSGEDD